MNNLIDSSHITVAEAKYLKYMGATKDIKVSIHIVGRTPLIHIMDHEFKTFDKALAFLQFAFTQVLEPGMGGEAAA